jgi:SAM-dependent MidA family methyltransferase
VLVERSERLRDMQRGRVPMEPARQVLGPAVVTDPDEGPHAVPGIGPLVTSLGELPQRPFVGAVIANELLDNLPFAVLEKAPLGWSEVRVGAQLDELLVAAAPDIARRAAELAPDAPDGGRIPLQEGAADWLRAAIEVVERGFVVVFDYASTTAEMARRPWHEWVRTYRRHSRGGAPLEHLGEQDITCEVAVDQLPPPDRDRSQAEFLRSHGLDDLVGAARSGWQERAHVGDLDALKHRSRISEGDALTDDSGLGAFRVLEWEVRR